uniref:Uncharacterized protein n=1 Tax=Anguilla anguilla TaxID=7936 RepID=A0A0E9Y1L6_ANGAN
MLILDCRVCCFTSLLQIVNQFHAFKYDSGRFYLSTALLIFLI